MRLRLVESGELVGFTPEGNRIGVVDLSDPVTTEAMRLAIGGSVEIGEPCVRCQKMLVPSNCATQGNYAKIVCPNCHEPVEYKG